MGLRFVARGVPKVAHKVDCGPYARLHNQLYSPSLIMEKNPLPKSRIASLGEAPIPDGIEPAVGLDAHART